MNNLKYWDDFNKINEIFGLSKSEKIQKLYKKLNNDIDLIINNFNQKDLGCYNMDDKNYSAHYIDFKNQISINYMTNYYFHNSPAFKISSNNISCTIYTNEIYDSFNNTVIPDETIFNKLIDFFKDKIEISKKVMEEEELKLKEIKKRKEDFKNQEDTRTWDSLQIDNKYKKINE